MNAINYYFEAWKKYAVFSGRAKRKEYWYFVLFNVLIYIFLSIITGTGATETGIADIYSLVALIPGIAVAVRRLHDIGKSGWWMFISLIPLVGAIMLIIFLARDSQPGENKYGPGNQVAEGPKEGTAPVAHVS